MNNALVELTTNLALTLGMGNSEGLVETMKATAFKGQQVTDDQMIALMAVATQHKLNPWTNEIYAFPSKGAIIPVVGVDGWSSIINRHPQFDGMDFEQDDTSCTCTIYRKDRSHPIRTTEYLSECKRDTQPWKSHPKRMLRHKALIQGARMAFGYTGFYDPDEAERINEVVDMGSVVSSSPIKNPVSKSESKTIIDNETGEIQGSETPSQEATDKKAEANTNLATAGEKKHLLNKAGSEEALQEALKVVGIADYDNLTKDGFVALKDHFASL